MCVSVCDVLVSFRSPWQNDKRNVFCHKISFRKRVINNIKFDAGRPLYTMSSLSLAPLHKHIYTYVYIYVFKSVCVFGSCPGLSFWAFCGTLNTCYFMILLGTQHATWRGVGGLPPPSGRRGQVHSLVFETWQVNNELSTIN